MTNMNQGGPGRFNNGIVKQTPKEVKEFHTNDDVDSGKLAHHHTLGFGNNQAANGAEVAKALEDLGLVDASLGELIAALDLRLDPFDTNVPYATGERTVTAGSFTSGTYHTILTPNNQDLEGGITYAAGTGLYTVPKDGRYEISASVGWASNATAWRGISIVAGGVTRTATYQAANGTASTPHISFTQRLLANDTVLLTSRQQSGGNLALDLTAGLTWISINWVGP